MIKDLYPFSTKNGNVIPLDIVRPLSLFSIPFTAVGATALLDLAVATPIVLLRTTKPCFVRFGAQAVAPGLVATAEEIYLSEGEIMVVAPKSTSISVLGETVSGTLVVQLIEQWAGTGHEAVMQAI